MKKILTKISKRTTKKVKVKLNRKDGKECDSIANIVIKKQVKIKINEQPKKEKVPIINVYKEEEIIKTEVTDDICDYELFGFLKLFIRRMGKLLEGDMEEREDLG